MSGDVKFVNAVDGGAEPKPSLNRSLGDTVWADETPVLIAVKLDSQAKSVVASMPAPKLASRLSNDVAKSGWFVRDMSGDG
jgi:hypothetical protein